MKAEDCEKGETGLKGERGRKMRLWWTICDMKAEMETNCGEEMDQQEEVEIRGEQ